jgi:hypothetical protein
MFTCRGCKMLAWSGVVRFAVRSLHLCFGVSLRRGTRDECCSWHGAAPRLRQRSFYLHMCLCRSALKGGKCGTACCELSRVCVVLWTNFTGSVLTRLCMSCRTMCMFMP